MLMRYLDLEKHLTAISDQPGRTKEVEAIRTAIGQFKDLRGFEHNNQVMVCGTEINPYCDNAELFFEENDLIAMPYTDDKGVRLYSSAAAFYIGYRNQKGFGVVPYVGWEEHLKAHFVGKDAIKAIDRYLKAHAPADYF